MKRPAAPHALSGPFDAATTSGEDVLHGVVDLRLTGIHHAPREEQDVSTVGRRASTDTAEGKAGRKEGRAGHQAQSLEHGEDVHARAKEPGPSQQAETQPES
jgi:hypothetical protein